MKKWLKRIVASGFLSMAVFGGAASAAWCGKPCNDVYLACKASGTDQAICQANFEECMELRCGGNP